jgi:TPR repeat protein
MGSCGSERSWYSFRFDSSRRLKHRSNFLPIIVSRSAVSRAQMLSKSAVQRTQGETGDVVMSFEICDRAQADFGRTSTDADMLFELGIVHSSGRGVPIDYIAAHKWFNLAAMRGNENAVRLRREIAAEMTDAEIAAAQRAARDWLRRGEPALAVAA